MRATLDIPYVDTSAASLALSLNGRDRLALASLTCRAGSSTVVLSVLGGSHQVTVRAAGAALSEVVACDPASPAPPDPLPRTASTVVGSLRHDFRARVDHLDDVTLRRTVDDLVATLAERPDAIVALFPGDAHAVTALALDDRPDTLAAWTTWHAYPTSGEIVRTWSSLVRA